MSLFIIPSQSVFGKSFAKPLAKAFRKTSIVSVNYLLLTHIRVNFCWKKIQHGVKWATIGPVNTAYYI